MGGVTSTPVINRPEVAIIAVNKVREMPVIVDGELEARKLMNLSLSCDHRVVDGWDAANFMQSMKGLIENPQPDAASCLNDHFRRPAPGEIRASTTSILACATSPSSTREVRSPGLIFIGARDMPVGG